MMRVSQCCCGCSLKVGTLILLWLDLLHQASTVVKATVAACSSERKFTFLDSAMLGWGCLALVIIIYGIVGVEKHRPSYLLPYIGTGVFSLVALILVTLILWVGSLAMRNDIIDSIAHRLAMTSPGQAPSKADIGKLYNEMVSTITIILIVCIALSMYFLCVVYSYYKQMQEEDKGIFNPPGTGIVYAAPADQTKGFGDNPPAYVQQPAAYPQQNVGYPQPVAGYPQPVAGYPQQQFPSYPQKQ